MLYYLLMSACLYNLGFIWYPSFTSSSALIKFFLDDKSRSLKWNVIYHSWYEMARYKQYIGTISSIEKFNGQLDQISQHSLQLFPIHIPISNIRIWESSPDTK